MERIQSDKNQIKNENEYCEKAYDILSQDEDIKHIFDKIFTYLDNLKRGNIEKVLNKDVYSKIIEIFNQDTSLKDIVDFLLPFYLDLFDI